MLDLAIIGAGPAGLTAALYASRAGASVTVIEAGAPGGKLNLTADIENYPGIKKMQGPQLAYQMYEHGLSFGASLEMREVTGLEDHGDYKVVKTSTGDIEAKNVIIASGTKERKMNVPGEEELTGHGVSYCAVCDGPFFKGKEVAVVGGGNSAIEEAVYLSTIASTVHVVMRRDVFRADKIISDKALAADNIVFHFKKKPHAVLSEDGKVSGLEVSDSDDGSLSVINVSAVFPFVGNDPVTGFAKDLGILDERGYVLTDEHMETKVKGIFAIGDVRQKDLRQVVTATNDGAIAGQYIANSLR
ncbi:thioredoxin-disulfide reductase [Intestinibaculum porci]|uniref:thioredoxin-disulfide reductase n=1 Tax=Intestinibaculum porci TaxID=2487118 RepID=UPI002409087A|nr:thioredoxin-disulfide reductase [Intestinibaculum porci]MDD6349203.1 thioredoxin-disulfide reductase [Intestinibaculum porci]MDD6423091.1 thioredoxin-disulfide reductase [Intestinibaculum porci]